MLNSKEQRCASWDNPRLHQQPGVMQDSGRVCYSTTTLVVSFRPSAVQITKYMPVAR